MDSGNPISSYLLVTYVLPYVFKSKPDPRFLLGLQMQLANLYSTPPRQTNPRCQQLSWFTHPDEASRNSGT